MKLFQRSVAFLFGALLGIILVRMYQSDVDTKQQLDKMQQRTKEVEAKTDEIYRFIKLLEDTFE